MMKIALFGDVHGYFERDRVSAIEVFQRVVGSIEADLLLQVGDLCYYRPLPRPVYWIYGNNDAPALLRERQRAGPELHNLRLLGTGEVLTIRHGAETLRLAGLNGAHDPLCYRACGSQAEEIRRQGFFVEEDLQQCTPLRGLDIFLAHGCPEGLGICWQGQEIGEGPLRELLEQIETRYFFCGHVHLFHRAHFRGIEVISLAEFREEYYLFDSRTETLERIRTRP
ncbi:MAG: metallophosphoesterase [Candidatus Tectomicrobia bacterium]|uniref:Metallophosphoesterase n=1 Tax=Tectimicrobiota bacterium TaxID=2528274 RepID=A0A932CPG6_UNCTE|nr:metallophosphoesterase [Candidatus Tectomicrobia bacterium]